MVATSKMRRAQERMKLARPYAEKMRTVIGHLNQANPDYRHPFLVSREPKAVGIIVISTDRGLAGGLNANLFKQVLLQMREWQDKGAQVSLSIDRQQGHRLLPPPRHPDTRQRHRTGRPAAHQGPDRHHQGHARCLPRRQDRPPVPGEREVREHHDAAAARRRSCCRSRPLDTRRAAGALGLHLRARRVRDPGWPADALHRVAGVPGRRRERRLRDGGAHGRHEGRHRTTPASSSRIATRSTTRPARLRSRRNFRRSSAARRPFEEDTHDQLAEGQDHPDHRRRHRRRISARARSRRSTKRCSSRTRT